MSEVLQDLSASVLAKAIEANLHAFSAFSRKWPAAEIHEGSDLSWCITGIPTALCNIAFNARLQAEEIDTVIEELKAKV